MSNCSLIIGPSGSGKSTSLRNLEWKSTFIISVLGKPLPIKGFKKHYIDLKGWDDKEGNYFVSDDWVRILRCIKMINDDRPDIKTLVLEDAQYIMAHEYMRRASETGFNKYVELGQHMWSIINSLIATRSDLYCFVISHNDIDQTGKSKCKTIGKMLDEKITLEGMYTIVLHTIVNDEGYKFLTQNDGLHTAKSPLGMFEDKLIDNDLAYVINKIKVYEESE